MEALTVLVTLSACMAFFHLNAPKEFERLVGFIFFLFMFFFSVINKSIPQPLVFSFNVKAHDGPSVCH